MATLTVYNLNAEKTGTIDVPDELFAVPVSHVVLHTVATVLLGNRRQPWAHTKDRSERRGGGKKPWKQKGTGNARHGSIRSPLWRKGGVTFGPRNDRNYTKKVNKKVKRQAFLQAISSKVQEEQLFVLDGFDFTKPSTKAVVRFFEKCVGSSSALVVTAKTEPVANQSVRNIPRVSITHADVVNVPDLLSSKNVILTRGAVDSLLLRLGTRS